MSVLLSEIEAFCSFHELSEWQFGEMAMNDRHFIRQLREGRDVRVSTVERVRQFIAGYSPPEMAA